MFTANLLFIYVWQEAMIKAIISLVGWSVGITLVIFFLAYIFTKDKTE